MRNPSVLLSLLTALVIQTLPATVAAHGGGLDANGCHTNRKTGEYHCHRSAPSRRSNAERSAEDSGDYRCGAKRYCTEMTSCSEAMHHFTVCGLSRLDGDRDGVPCEKLCR